MIKLGVAGAMGKMGQRILELAANDPDIEVFLALEKLTHPEIGAKIAGVEVVSDKEMIRHVDGLIDFSSVDGTLDHLRHCVKFKKPIVIGTTGFSEEQKKEIGEASRAIGVVFSPNMSIGVNLLFELTRQAARALPPDYRVSMTEAHHVHKKDAPSGTAKFLADIAKQERSLDDIPIRSIREGEIVGDHEVVFESPWDTITISHHAKTRDIFARGALTALKFVVKKKHGLYTMADVLAQRS
ncbi:MAG: 4-hydroxy-tetrahydrodipicolinate reductase [Candidatus Omnitrophica bacterium]|nr:4-hydroxy-tetrahydrodipicolinate reductase [Candidatus Omnitrophota bacterium]MDD5574830.1 4-hydroxy-tetrahydrodipicolinate reductase [Candidatus Omnitrophota bacterium]